MANNGKLVLDPVQRLRPFVVSLSNHGGRSPSTSSGRTASRFALACACGLLLVGGGVIAADKATTHTVAIDGVAYRPETLTVKRGDTVVWVNKDPFPHTVTAKGSFDSHDIAAGRSWKYGASKSGEYAYICTLHPNMKGTLKVE